jgi:hypothetical protein
VISILPTRDISTEQTNVKAIKSLPAKAMLWQWQEDCEENLGIPKVSNCYQQE